MRTEKSQVIDHGEIRIIAGLYRGRRLRFPIVPGLRPSPDRIRETVFSWLLPWLPQARCLDLFAGSGALGFEAASRGAREVLLNDGNAQVAAALNSNRALFAASNITVSQKDALQLLQTINPGFDIIFLDPPFRAEWLPRVLTLIVDRQLLAPDGIVYIESESEGAAPALPVNWFWHREKSSGQVRYGLAKLNPEVSTGNNSVG